MKENKSEQYTYGSDEKETLEILSSFEKDFEQIQTQKQNQNLNKDQENTKLQLVKYYESFKISKSEISGIFLAEQKDAEGNISYHLYFQSPSNEILSVDHEGNIKINPQWEQVIGYIDFEKCMYINDSQQGRLKGITEKAEPEEIQERLQNKKVQNPEEQDEQKKDAQKDHYEEESQEEQEENPEEQIEKDLSGENQEDLGISYYRQIKDENFEDQIGMDLKGYKEIGLAYSKNKNAFIFVGKKDGHFQQVEGFEQAQPTNKTVMSIDEKGESVKKEVPHAIMETSNPEKGLSITIGQYGYIEVGTVERTPCNKIIKRQVREQGQGIEGQEKAEITRDFSTEGKYYGDEIAHKKQILEREYNVTETDIEELKELDIEALIEEEADRVKISKEGFKRYVKEASGKTLKEKISNAQDEIIEEYMGHGRPRSN